MTLPTPPLRRDGPTLFADRGDAFMAALPTFETEMTALGVSVNANAVTASAAAIAAAGSAAAAGAIAWVSGTTYAIGNARYSPIDFQTYRRKTSGAGTTDPSLDSTNWARVNVAAPSVTRSARTSNTILAEDDRGTLIDITSGTFSQTFTAAATLTTGWYCWIKNSGTGVITLDPNSSELINGASTLVLSYNQSVLVQCDGTGFYAVVRDGPVGVTRSARTSNTILAEDDRGTLIDITSGTFSQTFTAAATLTTGWYCWIKNSGTGVITLDPNSSELINGASTLVLSYKQSVLVQCDGTGFYAVVCDGPVGDHSVTVTTGNGRGSTNWCIRRFTTTLSSSGTAITYADSATLGASFTINEPGLYAISYSDNYAISAQPHGVSLNSAQLTTGITTITAANRLGMVYSVAAGVSNVLTLVARLALNDVVRPHETGINNGTNAADTYFTIRRIGS